MKKKMKKDEGNKKKWELDGGRCGLNNPIFRIEGPESVCDAHQLS